MKKGVFVPVTLLVSVLAAFLASFVSGSQAESAASEEALTLQMIAPYRSWGKANVQPIVFFLDQTALSG